MTGLFFTGTDTSVGKTFVAAAVVRELRRQGHAVQVCKPVATGAASVSEDTRLLAEAAGTDDYRAVTPWTFAEPAAPPVAARCQKASLRLDDLVAAVRRQGEPVVVEGVGGLLCPLTETETVADLAARLRQPLVIVTRRSLGTLNHTLLTVEAAQRRGLTIAGLVVNATQPVRTIADETNVAELGSRVRLPILAVVPYYEETPAAIPALASVDWWRILQGA
jgi:dethiobiotin synthetase